MSSNTNIICISVNPTSLAEEVEGAYIQLENIPPVTTMKEFLWNLFICVMYIFCTINFLLVLFYIGGVFTTYTHTVGCACYNIPHRPGYDREIIDGSCCYSPRWYTLCSSPQYYIHIHTESYLEILLYVFSFSVNLFTALLLPKKSNMSLCIFALCPLEVILLYFLSPPNEGYDCLR